MKPIQPKHYSTVGDYVKLKRDYIESLSVVMTALRDFGSIGYAWDIHGGEYVRICDMIGNVIFLDVTNMTRAEILKDVARCILLDDADLSELVPGSIVEDIDEKREIARLFN